MKRELAALLEVKVSMGEDGQELVEGCIIAVREFVLKAGEEADLLRLAELLKHG